MVSKENLETIVGLSPVQEVLLFHCIDGSASDDLGFQHVEFVARGMLEPDRFAGAWQCVLARHAALRSTFHWKDLSKPVQVVHRTVTPVIDYFDLRPGHRIDGVTTDTIRSGDRQKGFDLSIAPLCRVTVIRTGEDEYHVLWAIHHLVADGWSSSLVLSEVFEIYNRVGESGTLDSSPPSYPEFVEWLTTRDSSGDIAFWRRELADVTPPDRLYFGTGRGGRSESDEPQQELVLKLERQLSEQIGQAARRSRVSLATFLQAAWAMTISCVADTDEVVFGLTLAGRPAELPGAESTIGLFSTTMPVRVRIDPESQVDDWLEALNRSHARIVAHQHIAPVTLQSVCDPPLNHLFETVLVVENYPKSFVDMPADGVLRVTESRGGIASAYPLTALLRPGTELVIAMHVTPAYAKNARHFADVLRDTLHVLSTTRHETVRDVMDRIRVPSSIESSPSLASETPFVRAIAKPTNMGGRSEPLTAIQDLVSEIWCDVLGLPSVGLHQQFLDLGGDSIRSLQIVARLREAGYVVSPVALLSHPTIAKLAAELDGTTEEAGDDSGGAAEKSFQPLVLMKPGGNRAPLFCLHPPGGDPIIFADLARAFTGDRPIYGVKSSAAAGLLPMDSFDEMVEAYIPEMRRVLPDGPYHLFSECAGSILTLEVAAQMERMGLNVGAAILLDPGWIHPERAEWYEHEGNGAESRPPLLARAFHYGIEGQLGRRVSSFVRARIRRSKARRVRTDYIRGLSEDHRRAYDSFNKALHGYVPSRYTGSLTIMLTPDWEAGPNWPRRSAGWSQVAKGGMKVLSVAGTHSEALARPAVADVARLLSDVLLENEERYFQKLKTDLD